MEHQLKALHISRFYVFLIGIAFFNCAGNQATTTDIPFPQSKKVWHADPGLKDRFHPEYPDDLQVIIHKGSSYTSQSVPELVWVTVISEKNASYSGILLNQPSPDLGYSVGDTIYFKMPSGIEYPLTFTREYLQDRSNWHIEPCSQCGFDELFDLPVKIYEARFPNLRDIITEDESADISAFSLHCELCGGIQKIYHLETALPEDSSMVKQDHK